MMRRRPSQHYRRVHTRSGHKRVLINQGVKKRGIINPPERRIFNNYSKPHNKVEYGGKLDFGKKGVLERFSTEIGRADEVEIPDYEAQWHTHPDPYFNPPSPDDITSLLKNRNQQAEVVFNNERVVTITKTPRTKALSSLPEKTLLKRFDVHWGAAMKKSKVGGSGKPVYDEFAKRLGKEGFLVTTSAPSDKMVKIPIKVVE